MRPARDGVPALFCSRAYDPRLPGTGNYYLVSTRYFDLSALSTRNCDVHTAAGHVRTYQVLNVEVPAVLEAVAVLLAVRGRIGVELIYSSVVVRIYLYLHSP